MNYTFPFGRRTIEISIPAEFSCITLGTGDTLSIPDDSAALEYALENPIGSAPLVEIAKDKRNATIVVCDITRPAPNRKTLPPVLKSLLSAGVSKDAITILIATGLHRVATQTEIVEMVGVHIASSYKIISNDARDHGKHRYLGTTRRGTPVHIHECYVEADLRITLGLIEPHLMAGFSGGRKLVVPGVAGEQTIKAIHSPKFMREPLATEGSVRENPLHRELVEIAGMARQEFILDVTLTRERRISGVFAGNALSAHEAGMRFLELNCREEIQEYADLVITSAAGFPLDLTFYQTIKAITAAAHLVKPGGRILVISECLEGAGSNEFTERLRNLGSFEAFLAETANALVEIDQWQLEKLALVGIRTQLFFHMPGMNRNDLGCLHGSTYESIGDALRVALHGLSSESKIVLMPQGPYTFGRVAWWPDLSSPSAIS